MTDFFKYLTMPYLWQGVLLSVQMTVVSMVLALVLGLGLALMRESRIVAVRSVAIVYIWFIRGTPLLLQLVLLYTALPTLGIPLGSVETAILGFTLNEAAFAGEIMRGGIRSVNRTQMLAAQSLGMSTWLSLRKIILPQALRAVLPALGNDTISMLKATSLASVVAVNELMLRSQTIVSQNFLFFQVFSAAAAMYLVLTTILSIGQAWLEAKLQISSRNTVERGGWSRMFGFDLRRGPFASVDRTDLHGARTATKQPVTGGGLTEFIAGISKNQPAKDGEVFVDCRNVSKSYGTREVLSGVNLQVRRGEVVVLMGPSGSGKSTMLRLINHLEAIDGGEVLVGGEHVGYREVNGRLKPVRNLPAARARARIGMVFQHFNLFDHLPAGENVSIAPVYVFGEEAQAARQTAEALLQDVGLGAHLQHLPHSLSGGQQQRVAIARALAISPRLMLFDEPTSALDPELVGEVLSVMRRLAEAGMTMIVVTHEVRFARAVADRVVFMADGMVVEEGPPEQVLDRPTEERTRKFLGHLQTDNN